MIGFVVYKENEYQLADLLAIFSYAYRVPFCSFKVESVAGYLEKGTLSVRQWNGDRFEQVTLNEFPVIVDSYHPLSVIAKQCPEKAQLITEIRTRAKTLRQRSLHKDELAIAMMRSHLCQYAIPTFSPKTYEELSGYIKIFGNVILKPSHGREGVGVLKLCLADNGEIKVVNQNCYDDFTKKDFLRYLESDASVRGGVCILQPYLNFRLDDGRAFDFRLLCHRGLRGTWETVASYARIGSNSVTSNLAQGGCAGQTYDILKQIAGDKSKDLLQEVEMLGQEVPLLVEKFIGEDAFCIGIDVGVDRDTVRPYVIETNALPGTKFHLYQFAEKRVQYYKYLLRKFCQETS